jgi:hypothetical protein
MSQEEIKVHGKKPSSRESEQARIKDHGRR